MATVAIGDIHGNLAALDDLLARLDGELHAGDTVVFLGDYIDRGRDSKGCIDRILRLRAEGPARVVTLLGNHEEWMLEAREDPRKFAWLTVMEGLATVASYSQAAADVLVHAMEEAGPRLVTDPVALPYGAFFDAMPREHWAFFEELEACCRTSDGVYVHGGLDPGRGGLEHQARETMIWGHDRFLTDYAGPDIVVYGHWDNADVGDDGWPRPAMGRATVGIDTISHGILTAFRLPGHRVVQSARFPRAAGG